MTVPPPQSQNPQYNNAPNDTQAISIGNNYPATGSIYPPGQHPRVKQLLNLTLVSGALFVLGQIVGAFSPVSISKLISAILGAVVVAALYALVYTLIKKGKKSGRVTGMVFCIIGLIVAAFGTFAIFTSPMPFGLLSSLIYLAAAIVNIFWLMRASHADVKANLV